MELMEKYKLTVKLTKCVFDKEEIDIFGS